MKSLIKGIFLILGMFPMLSAFAQETIEGTWEGQLEVAPGNSISVHFALSQEGGNWSAVLNSPDMGAIKDIKASSVSFDGSKLDIDVVALSGSYSGMLSNGAFTGEWTQPGSTLEMNLSPFIEKEISEETIATLMGQWHGKLMGPGITFNMIFHFERDDDGKFVGFIQNADAGPQKQPLSDISLEGNDFKFRVPAAQAEYVGSLVGEAITGHLKQGPQNMELNVEKGIFVAEIPQLDISDADFEQLNGKWIGALSSPQGELVINLRFERNEDNTIVSFIDSVTQGAVGLKVTSASLTEGHLDVELSVPPAKFEADLEGSTLTGSWIQGPGTMPLVLTKE